MDLPVVAIDPSSRKLATVTTYVFGQKIPFMENFILPLSPEEACAEAFRSVASMLLSIRTETGQVPRLYLEEPVLGRGGPGSTIPQARVGGAIMAAAAECECPVILVNNQSWKKAVCGSGGIGKPEVAKRMRKIWPEAFRAARGDQDLIDSSAINLLGQRNARVRVQLHRRIGS
jgi:Holliday junction resolvasome RuvABC endonuclease subunit